MHGFTVKWIGLLFWTNVEPDTKQFRYKSYIGNTEEVVVVKDKTWEG